MVKEVIAPKNVFESRGKYLYSQAIKVGNTVYISGQGAADEEGNILGKGDIETQSRQAFENIKRLVETAGGNMTDVVYMTFYCKDIRQLRSGEKFAGVMREYFGDYCPCTTAVQVANLYLSDMVIEIDAVAVVEQGHSP
jgi:2-iminobutanoate/2-iminopropanoate deaminase